LTELITEWGLQFNFEFYHCISNGKESPHSAHANGLID